VRDVVVVGETAVLCHLPMAGIEEEVHVVTVSKIRSEECTVEVRQILIAVVAARVSIVKVEADVDALSCIHGEFRVDVVFSVCLVAAVVILDIGLRRQRVHEEKRLWALFREAVWLGEDKIVGHIRTIDEDTAQTGGVVATRSVVFTVNTVIEGGVHKEVGQGVGNAGNHVTEFPVNRPNIESLRYLLIACGVVVVLVEVVVLRVLGDITRLVNLIVGDLGHNTSYGQHQRQQQCQSCFHLIILKDDSAILKHIAIKMI